MWELYEGKILFIKIVLKGPEIIEHFRNTVDKIKQLLLLLNKIIW